MRNGDDASATRRAGDDGCIFGQFGAAINFTDGRYAYFLYPQEPFDADLYQYTLMPAHMRTFFEASEFTDAQIVHSLPFAQGFPVLAAAGAQGREGEHDAPLPAARCTHRAVRPRHRSAAARADRRSPPGDAHSRGDRAAARPQRRAGGDLCAVRAGPASARRHDGGPRSQPRCPGPRRSAATHRRG